MSKVKTPNNFVDELIPTITNETTIEQTTVIPETKPLSIYQAMAAILADVDAVSKNRQADMGKAGNYKFRGIDDMYNSLHKSFAKYKVFIIPEILNNVFEVQEREKTYQGNTTKSLQYSSILTVKFTFVSEDGTSISATGIGHALDTSDKATNKAQSSALKYCLMQTFLIPTEDAKDVEVENIQAAPIAMKNVTDNQFQIMKDLMASKTSTECRDTISKMMADYKLQNVGLTQEQSKELKTIYDGKVADETMPKEAVQDLTEVKQTEVETNSMPEFTDVEFEQFLEVFSKLGLEGVKAELEIVQSKYTMTDKQKKSLETITQAKLF